MVLFLAFQQKMHNLRWLLREPQSLDVLVIELFQYPRDLECRISFMKSTKDFSLFTLV